MKPVTLGLIVGNRGFFPSHLCESGRAEMIDLLEKAGFKVIALSPQDTPYGTVESLEDAHKCAELFDAHRKEIDGVVVTLPNFGDERAVANSLRWSGLDVPVLIQAYPDAVDSMTIADRRDSFCGKMSLCNNLRQYKIPYTLTRLHTVVAVEPELYAGPGRLRRHVPRHQQLAQPAHRRAGRSPTNFNTVRFSEKLLETAAFPSRRWTCTNSSAGLARWTTMTQQSWRS